MLDRMVPWQEIAGVGGRVGLNLLPDVGHVPQLEEPHTVAAILDELIRSA